MNIAVIGWGSLIWCPGSLRIRTGWYRDGPRLPVEFARISGDGRLTLVIHPACEEQTTYWALGEYDDLLHASKNLSKREGCHITDIASVKTDDVSGPDTVKSKIKEWLKSKPKVGAAMWTNLRTNWQKKRGQEFMPEDALRYLRELEQRRQETANSLKYAREYVRNAPEQIQTQVRKRMSAKTEWADNKLAETLFEPR